MNALALASIVAAATFTLESATLLYARSSPRHKRAWRSWPQPIAI